MSNLPLKLAIYQKSIVHRETKWARNGNNLLMRKEPRISSTKTTIPIYVGYIKSKILSLDFTQVQKVSIQDNREKYNPLVLKKAKDTTRVRYCLYIEGYWYVECYETLEKAVDVLLTLVQNNLVTKPHPTER